MRACVRANYLGVINCCIIQQFYVKEGLGLFWLRGFGRPEFLIGVLPFIPVFRIK
jgi:hypothetical protein